MRYTIIISILIAISIASSSAYAVDDTYDRQPDDNKVIVRFNSQYMETTYSIINKTCRIAWTVYKSELNKGVVHHRLECKLPLNKQLPMLAKILAKIFKDEENSKSFHTLFWGRLAPDINNGNLEMSFNLAIAAYKSPLWDLKRGKPKKGNENPFIVSLANKANIYGKLRVLFERFDRRLVFSSAEKVLITKAYKLPFFERLKKHGVNAANKLPFDCLTWFSVSKINH